MPHSNLRALPWIEIGYELFAKEGPAGLKVEVMARQVYKSKSSFYHLFADMEQFQSALLQYHIIRATQIAERAGTLKRLDPDLLQLFLEIKTDLCFNRQLRIHRQMPGFKACFEQANHLVESAFMPIWSAYFGLKHETAQQLLEFSRENFYLQLTEEHFTYQWVQDFLIQIRKGLDRLKA